MPLFGHSKPASSSVSFSMASNSQEKDIRGIVIRLRKHAISLEKKLAEGGFAIVYLAIDKNGRKYALKRQFINDDQRQLESCKRECQIISGLANHKNIITYVDHLISQNRDGIYEYLLLTDYYRTSVLALMNERLASHSFLSPKEVVSIFCDMCEAVARLHHSQTPIIHRDLKVENILIDERHKSGPVYVLCDFGSATNKVLSTETHPHSLVEEEVLKYTTLSYRAPEMVDLYLGRPIGTKSDIWALGVMLYKLCYFSLPFGESALAIQNGHFSFPDQPQYPDQLKALILMYSCPSNPDFLLESDLDLRPDIHQTSAVAFRILGRRCPVPNLNKVPTPNEKDLLILLTRKNGRKNQQQQGGSEEKSGEKQQTPTRIRKENIPLTTTVNPRLRPKATSNQKQTFSPNKPRHLSSDFEPQKTVSNPDLTTRNPDVQTENVEDKSENDNDEPKVHPNELGFTDLGVNVNASLACTIAHHPLHEQNLLAGTLFSAPPPPPPPHSLLQGGLLSNCLSTPHTALWYSVPNGRLLGNTGGMPATRGVSTWVVQSKCVQD